MNLADLNLKRNSAQRSCERGNALLELALVLPLMLILAFSSFEATRVLRFQQRATTLSRELASFGYRECLGDRSAVGSPRFDPQTCLTPKINDEFFPKVDGLAPDMELIVSLYTYDGTTVRRDAFVEHKAVGSTFVSKFSQTELQQEMALSAAQRSNLANALVNYGTIVTGEVSLPYTGMINITPRYVAFNTSSVYAASIL